MKKIATLLIVVAVAVAGFALYPNTEATALDGAVVIRPDSQCGLFDGDGGFLVTPATIQIVATPSNNTNTHIRCKATVPNNSGTATFFDAANTGFPCIFTSPNGLQTTTNWHETVSASGKATLVCHAP